MRKGLVDAILVDCSRCMNGLFLRPPPRAGSAATGAGAATGATAAYASTGTYVCAVVGSLEDFGKGEFLSVWLVSFFRLIQK